MLIIYRHCGPLYRKPNAVNENLLEVTHKFCKVIEHKINIQNLLCLHAINRQPKQN